jgi:predicted nuclease with TOPRIM domain
MDSTLMAEQEILKKLETEKRRGNNAEYYRQRTEVFHLKQRFDELEAKVKFYLRKIEVDMLENKRDTGNKEQD